METSREEMVAMTHDELLDKIGSFMSVSVNELNQLVSNNLPAVALRAIVELHKPSDGQCYECHYEGRDYPCPTIQAIEKELS